MDLILLTLTLAPSLILLIYFYTRDRYSREPKLLITKVFFWGVLSLIPMALAEVLLEDIFNFESISPPLLQIFLLSFASAALIEEGIKYVVIKRVAYRSPHFDEVVDGIVYAIVASLGMATLENILYVSEGGLGVALLRAVTAVPSHAFASGVMGYFIGLAKFATSKEHEKKLLMKGLFAAILLHGAYDFFLFTGSWPVLLVFPLLYLEYRMVHHYLTLAHAPNPSESLSLKFLLDDAKKYTWRGWVKVFVAAVLFMSGAFVAVGLMFMFLDAELTQDAFISGLLYTVALPWLLGFVLYRWRKKSLRHPINSV